LQDGFRLELGISSNLVELWYGTFS
jgi:hypothetical protein